MLKFAARTRATVFLTPLLFVATPNLSGKVFGLCLHDAQAPSLHYGIVWRLVG